MSLKDQPQLQQTELGRLTASAGGLMETHRNQIYGGVAAVVVLIGLAAWLTRDRSAEFEDGWSQFAGANSAGEFGKVASDHPDEAVADWGTLFEAELQLNEAVRLMFTDRAAARSQLKTAAKGFDAVLSSDRAPEIAKERALLGKAQLLEVTSDGGSKEVIEAYRGFLSRYKDTVHKDAVEERIKALESQEANDFYAWFHKQNPKPEDRKRPTDGFDPHGFDLPITLPPIPEELYPADWTELKTGEDGSDEGTDESSEAEGSAESGNAGAESDSTSKPETEDSGSDASQGDSDGESSPSS